MKNLPFAKLQEIHGNAQIKAENVYPEWIHAGLSDDKKFGCLAIKPHGSDKALNIVFPIEVGEQIASDIVSMVKAARDPNFAGGHVPMWSVKN